MVIAMYSHSALIGATDANVRLLPKMTANGNKFDVFSEIQTKKGTGMKWPTSFTKAAVRKIYNIRVDGTSLVTVYRNQFGELIKNKGIDGTIATVGQGLKKQ